MSIKIFFIYTIKDLYIDKVYKKNHLVKQAHNNNKNLTLIQLPMIK